jgi:uncharacterized protein YcbX
MEEPGHVRYISRYPVKSMRGEELESVEIGLQGLPGDRVYAFVQEGVYSSFPWLTGREFAGLLRYQPAWEDAAPRPKLVVATPSGASLPIDSAELREDIERGAGRKVRLHSDHRGNHDIAYVSLITAATVKALAEAGGVAADRHRFRMNFVFESDLPAFSEPGWVGKVLRLGDVRLAVTEQDQRCLMITLDPETGEATPAVLKAAGQLNGAYAGVYASVLSAGRVTVGDSLVIESA